MGLIDVDSGAQKNSAYSDQGYIGFVSFACDVTISLLIEIEAWQIYNNQTDLAISTDS